MTLTHDWFDNGENTLIDDPIDPSEANEPTLPIESTEPMLPIESTDPDDPTDRNESRLPTDHCPRGFLIGSAYAAVTCDSGAETRSYEPTMAGGLPNGMGGCPMTGRQND